MQNGPTTHADRQLEIHGHLMEYNDAVYAGAEAVAGMERDWFISQGFNAGHSLSSTIGPSYFVYSKENGTSIVSSDVQVDVYSNPMHCHIYHETADALAAFARMQSGVNPQSAIGDPRFSGINKTT